MNWITKILKVGGNIKSSIEKKFPTRAERAASKWFSCCKKGDSGRAARVRCCSSRAGGRHPAQHSTAPQKNEA